MKIAAPSIALRIPGAWDGPDELMLRLPDDYELDERGLHLPDDSVIEAHTLPPDVDFARIFAQSCDRLPSKEDRDKIENYTVNFCLKGPGGSTDAARRMLDAAAAILRAGGAGVFVDNSGVAHGSDDWLALADDDADGDVYMAFVSTIGSDIDIWSIGMHVLGLPDAVMPRTGDDEFDYVRINEFLGYTWRSGDPVGEGDLIGSEDGPEFQLKHEGIRDIPEGHPMYNPYGRWRLVPMTDVDALR